MFWLTPVSLSRGALPVASGYGYLAVTYRRPDKLAFLRAFGEQAQTISISPKILGCHPSATEDKQVTGEGIIIQHMLYLFSQSVGDLRISVTPARARYRYPDGSEIIFPSRSVHGSTL